MDSVSSSRDAVRLPWAAGNRDFALRLLVAFVLACIGGTLFLVDLPVARWCRDHRLPGDLARLVDLAEVFGHALGVAMIVGVVVMLDAVFRQASRLRVARWDLGRFVLAVYTGGLAVDVLKLAITRVRPRAIDWTSVTTVVDTFCITAWQLAADGGTAMRKSADLMSLPSGHSAVAAGLATALAWKYPHGLPVFVVLAIMATAQRVVSGAHYPSDVAFGAACGVVMAAICLGGSRPATTVLP